MVDSFFNNIIIARHPVGSRAMTGLKLIICEFLLFTGCAQPEEKNRELKEIAKAEAVDPLSSWNDGASKKAITDFIVKVTKQGNPDFIPVADRIACFDNDGTLWSEQPMYYQFIFAMDRVKELAAVHPEWKSKEPFSSILKGDMKAVLAGGEKSLSTIVAATHAGMTEQEFEEIVKNWMVKSKHPEFNCRYDEMTYKPMVELLTFLRENGFKTYIVSGGEEGFMRAWAEKAYGIPPEQIIGSNLKVVYKVIDGRQQLIRTAEMNFVDDKEGKPVGINDQIGKVPVFTVGNSDGDYAMLQWTTTTTGYPRMGVIVHHTDSVREWAYDRKSPIGHLEKGLDDAGKYGWVVVDMKSDWKEIFAR